MNNFKDNKVIINCKSDLTHLLSLINSGNKFAKSFKFKPYNLKYAFLNKLNIDIDDFDEKYFIYIPEKELHISESEFDYFWISTIGIVGKHNQGNKYYSSLESQYIMINLLFKEAIRISDEASILDIDSYYFGYMSRLTPVLFHNILFYIELFGKTYLSINKIKVPKTHNVSQIFRLLKETIFSINHNDSIFHAYVVKTFDEIIDYISTIPGNFKEQYIKYNDNSKDSTAIKFDKFRLVSMQTSFEISNDIISDLIYYSKTSSYLKQGLFNRLISKAKDGEEKKEIEKANIYLLGR